MLWGPSGMFFTFAFPCAHENAPTRLPIRDLELSMVPAACQPGLAALQHRHTQAGLNTFLL